jgi:hypothetical protein
MSARKKERKRRKPKRKGMLAVPDLSLARPRPIIVPTPGRMIGFAAEAGRPQSRVRVEVSGFHTFDEGLPFYHMLEAFDPFLNAMGIGPCQVGNMLVVLGPKNTFIYADGNLPMIMQARPKRSWKAGESVFRDDIAGIDVLDFPNLQPPEDVGFLLLLSVGWRRGMCFDLRPLSPDHPAPSSDAFDAVKRMGGMVLAHLWFTERFLLSPDDWAKILAAGWFPFVFLPHDRWQDIFGAIQNGWDLSGSEQKIHDLWLAGCDDRLAVWRANVHFASHVDFLDRAIRAYKDGDWLTVVSLAAPRVEGLLRRAFGAWGKQREVLDKLAESVERQEHARSLLFPDRLRQYFEKVFFRFVQFSDPDLPQTRHTLAHGLVEAGKLTRKEALTLLLLIDHILYCMPLDDGAKPAPPISATGTQPPVPPGGRTAAGTTGEEQ